MSTVSIMPGIEARAPDRTETRSGFVASPNTLPVIFADVLQRLFDLRLQFLRIGFVMRIKIRAYRGRDREAGRHRQTEIGHLGEIGALAAEQLLQRCFALRFAVTERVDPFAFHRVPPPLPAFSSPCARARRKSLLPETLQMALISLRVFWTSRRLWPWYENIPREGERARLTPRFDDSAQAAWVLFSYRMISRRVRCRRPVRSTFHDRCDRVPATRRGTKNSPACAGLFSCAV